MSWPQIQTLDQLAALLNRMLDQLATMTMQQQTQKLHPARSWKRRIRRRDEAECFAAQSRQRVTCQDLRKRHIKLDRCFFNLPLSNLEAFMWSLPSPQVLRSLVKWDEQHNWDWSNTETFMKCCHAYAQINIFACFQQNNAFRFACKSKIWFRPYKKKLFEETSDCRRPSARCRRTSP